MFLDNRLKLPTFKLKSMRIKQSKDYVVNSWSGGTTTELFIFPSTANYKEFNFEFRLSTATVNDDYSLFTSLPSVSRKLLLLEGSFDLLHNDEKKSTLQPGNVDSFEGDWKTESFGRGIDFNLMMRNGTKGNLELISLQKGDSLKLVNNEDFTFYFIYKGYGTTNTDKYQSGDLFNITNEVMSLSVESETKVVKVSIQLN